MGSKLKSLKTGIMREELLRAVKLHGNPQWLSGKRIHLQCERRRRYRFDPWVGQFPSRRTWQPTPAFLPGKSHGQRTLVAKSPWSHQDWKRTEQLSMHTCAVIVGSYVIEQDDNYFQKNTGTR